MTGCSSSANSVSLYGGVVHVESGTARILNCTFGKGYYLRNNSAGNSGGAIFAAGGDIAVLNSTITANAAALSRGGYGGGPAIDAAGSAICRVGNTIIAGNTAMTGERGAEIAGAFVSLGHNLIGEAEGGTGYAPTDLLGSLDTPLLPLISLSIDDGGGPASPGLTYIPQACSPVIDAGDNALLFHPDFVGGACFDARLSCCPRVRGAAVGGGLTCTGTHSADYAPQNWRIEIVELLRVVQLYNMGGYHVCLEGEDGFCPNP